MRNRLAVTGKVVSQLFAKGRLRPSGLQYIRRNLQGTQAGQGITLLEQFDILVRVLMETLTVGLPPRSPHRSDRLYLHRVAQFKVRLDKTTSQLQDCRRHNPDLLQNPSTAYSVTSLLSRNLHLWSVELSNLSTDVGLELPAHPPKVIDTRMPPKPSFHNLTSLLSADGAILRITQGTVAPPAYVPSSSGFGTSGRSSPKLGVKQGELSPTEVKRKATNRAVGRG